MTDFLLSRESVEALEAEDSELRVSRDSVEALWQQPPASLRLSRESVESLRQTTVTSQLSRLSIEVLTGPILSIERWNTISF